MLAKLRTRLTFANVVSLIALFVALGGSSYAAIKVTGKNVKDSSLTGKDVKNSSLTGKDVKNSSLTTSDVKNRSLLSTDFKTGQLPAGPRGADGRNGTNGFGLLSYPFGAIENVGPGDSDPGTFIECPAGTFPTGGDAFAVGPDPDNDYVDGVIVAQGIDFTTGAPDGYFAAWNNTTPSTTVTVVIDAVCANASTVQAKAKAARMKAKRLR